MGLFGWNVNPRGGGVRSVYASDQDYEIAVGLEVGVGCEQVERFAHGLSDEEPVEGIAMVHWERGHRTRMTEVHRQFLEVLVANELSDLVQIGLQFSEADLYGDLPERRGGDMDCLSFYNGLNGERGESGPVVKPPIENVGVEKHTH